jgi:hypothetical protein
MGGAYGVYGEEVHTGLWWYNLKKRQHLKYPSVNRRITLKLIL